jgi:C1A family cysteine protease
MKLLLVSVLIFGGLAQAEELKKTYTEGTTWVSRYLEQGGDIKNITGLVRPEDWKKNAVFDDLKVQTTLPATFNWNDYSRLQPIRNQKSCGSCWAFSVSAAVESVFRILYPIQAEIDLAEQTLVSSCCSAGSCSGGYFTALNYIKSPGLPDEAQDPYLARNSSCKSGLVPKVKISRWAYIGDGNSRPSTEQIKQAIYDHGSVSVDVNGSFGSYTSGIYNKCNSSGTNHMVNLEGWNDADGGYWYMRNSWGADWGEAGYMKIKYKGSSGKNCNGIGNVAAYAVLDGIENLREHLGLSSK